MMAVADSKVGAKAQSVVESHLTDNDTRHKTEVGQVIAALDTMSAN